MVFAPTGRISSSRLAQWRFVSLGCRAANLATALDTRKKETTTAIQAEWYLCTNPLAANFPLPRSADDCADMDTLLPGIKAGGLAGATDDLSVRGGPCS